MQEVTHLASSLYTTGTNLSRSVSSAGEHHSDTYVSPVLPKRAETFGGFDNPNQVGFRLFSRKSHSPDDNSPKNEFENLKPHDSKLLVNIKNSEIMYCPFVSLRLIVSSYNFNLRQQYEVLKTAVLIDWEIKITNKMIHETRSSIVHFLS